MHMLFQTHVTPRQAHPDEPWHKRTRATIDMAGAYVDKDPCNTAPGTSLQATAQAYAQPVPWRMRMLYRTRVTRNQERSYRAMPQAHARNRAMAHAYVVPDTCTTVPGTSSRAVPEAHAQPYAIAHCRMPWHTCNHAVAHATVSHGTLPYAMAHVQPCHGAHKSDSQQTTAPHIRAIPQHQNSLAMRLCIAACRAGSGASPLYLQRIPPLPSPRVQTTQPGTQNSETASNPHLPVYSRSHVPPCQAPCYTVPEPHQAPCYRSQDPSHRAGQAGHHVTRATSHHTARTCQASCYTVPGTSGDVPGTMLQDSVAP